MTGPFPCLLLGLLLLVPSAELGAQPADEPMGWPLRPKPTEPYVPKPVPKEAVEQETPPSSPTEEAAAGDDRLSPETINADLAPLDRILLPIRPLDFVFEGERTALTRAEARALSRLARRLRGTENRVRITAHTDASGRSARDALRLSLTRALAIRGFLVREGVPVERIDLSALPHGGGKSLAGEGRVHIEQAPTQNAAAPE